MNDPDTQLYDYQEASSLQKRGWYVRPPEDATRPSQCVGVDYEGCPVRTPRFRCRWCNRTRSLRRAA